MCEGCLDTALEFQCEHSQSKDYAKQDEQKYLHDHAQVEGKQAQWEYVVQNDAIENGEYSKTEKLISVSIFLLKYLRVSCLIFASLSVQCIVETL